MKLISMTDFVPLMRMTRNKDYITRFWACERYAKFLKQPLSIGMFVACDEEGNVLEEPVNNGVIESHVKLKEYEKAKERVLFHDFSAIKEGENTIVKHNETNVWITWTKRCIEDLVRINPELTESAIKQIGL